ncbi:DUF3515 domain-containing protein [Rhodococcus sp. 14-2483-1-1]|uniref:DUF3515 domain-containing protein n=1 Tax=Nocardiaceae TaxID=85025 RepID=UPI00050CE77F|nr:MULTISPECIES: DUF3515 domain-containing protein [Rhodococcus]OZC82211.1 DUF3515 domain-containing protein [Rhodococcus sp. 06-412-2C]OZC95146.1 DUF3515 domain-containing protein [Rhodococcus sp. 06-412-2B]OZE74679.1 DUF3515 domain-containing protein [Rhodococcus sp. 15-649-2-2]OZF30203.1 DUF3515 domain-containing protein [Rhodococcus sp. 14-2483-1-1]QII00905.1 DUF3515 domain-containing protein [Rhodococcus fascians A21d2]
MSSTDAGNDAHDDNTDGKTDTDGTREQRHPAVIATAIALPVALVVGVLVAAIAVNRSPVHDPVALGPVDSPDATSAQCASLLDALPEDLGDYTAAELADPAPAGVRAWVSAEENAEPVVLRCGLTRPVGFDVAAPLQVIDGVQWFEVSGEDDGIDASTWFVVDRGVYIALTIPGDSGPTPLQDASSAVSNALPQQALDPAPLQ